MRRSIFNISFLMQLWLFCFFKRTMRHFRRCFNPDNIFKFVPLILKNIGPKNINRTCQNWLKRNFVEYDTFHGCWLTLYFKSRHLCYYLTFLTRCICIYSRPFNIIENILRKNAPYAWAHAYAVLQFPEKIYVSKLEDFFQIFIL